MTEDDDVPTVGGDTFRERLGGDAPDPDVSVSDYSKAAESLTESFDLGCDAVRSAMWHTIIDGAGYEDFVDELTVDALRDARHRIEEAGYATDGITIHDIYGGGDPPTEGAAYFAGDDAADLFEDLVDEMIRGPFPDHFDEFTPDLPCVDGFLVERVPNMPSHLIVVLDVAAIARVPAEARNVPMGLSETPTVSSPIVVRDGDGIAVVNIAE